MISVQSVDLTFETNDGPVQALKDVSFDIPKSKTVCGVSSLKRERKHPETPNPFNTMNTRSIQ